MLPGINPVCTPFSPAPWSSSCSVSAVQTDHKIPPALSSPCCPESNLYAPPFRLALGRLAFRACVCAAHLSPGETLRLCPHETMHENQNRPWESCRAPLLRLIDTPSPWPLIHSSPSSSSPPASPPASRHPASLPRLACFSRSGCPHPAHASSASTSSWLAKINSFMRRFCAGNAPPRFLCLPCAPARGVRCFLSSGFDCHGVLRPGECRGAREKLS